MQTLGEPGRLNLGAQSPAVIMLVGLQGAGKTTMAGKLALHLRKQGRRPLLVAADVYRPAAIDQLETLGKQLDIPVYSEGADAIPVTGGDQRREAGGRNRCDDGRSLIRPDALNIDDMMMDEIRSIKSQRSAD